MVKLFFIFFKILQENRSRVEIFHEYALKKNEPVCEKFLNLLNAEDGFINKISAQIIAKIACYSTDLIDQIDLQFYLSWINKQLLSAVSQCFNKISNNQSSLCMCANILFNISTELGCCLRYSLVKIYLFYIHLYIYYDL